MGAFEFLASSGWPGAGRNLSPRFDSVENVRVVYDQINRAQEQRRQLQSARP